MSSSDTTVITPIRRRRLELIEAARKARDNAFAPYSKFHVGAALRSQAKKIFTGCNVENATYGLTVCAERVAVWKAISEGARDFDLIAIVADTEKLTPPCGACRQILWEFCGDIEIILANLRGKVETHRLSELFPRPFDAKVL
jgi:cytidine deaminase